MLLERIAVEPTAEVFRAETEGESGGKSSVLIKKILPQFTKDQGFTDSLSQAAKVSKFLKHPNIMQVIDFGQVDETYYMATEYLTGRTLEEVLELSKEQRQPLELSHALQITTEICEGLAYAHSLTDSEGKSRNIIHRNISPQSVFITDEGNVKITEFGINTAERQDSSSQMGMFKGKVAYMSPEQVDRKAVDCQSDIFSLGVILYEMATGKQAFEGETIQIFSKVRQAQYEPPENIMEGLPSELCKAIHRALEKDPKDRYPSASEMVTQMKQVLSQVDAKPTASTLAQYLKKLSTIRAQTEIQPQETTPDPTPKDLDKNSKSEPFVKPKPESLPIQKETVDTEQNKPEKIKDDPKNPPEKCAPEPKDVLSFRQKSQKSGDTNPLEQDDKKDPVTTSVLTQYSKKDDPPLRATAPKPEKKPKVAPQDKVAAQKSTEPPGKDSVIQASSQESDKSAPAETGRIPSLLRHKTVLGAAVAALLVICIGTTLIVTKKSAKKGSHTIASPTLEDGVKALKGGRFEEAVSLFDQALANEPALLNKVSKPYAEALQGKAAAFAEAEPEKAEEWLLIAIEFDPESISAYSQLGLLYLKQRDYARAASSYETVIQLGAESPDTFFNLGYIYAITEDYAKAERSYSRAVQLAPSFLDEALFNLAMVQDKLGKRKQCIKNLKLATKANPSNKQASQYLKKLRS